MKVEGKVCQNLCGSSSNTKTHDNQSFLVGNQAKYLFDENFLQHFSFSPSLTLNNMNNSFFGSNSKLFHFTVDEPLIPTEQLLFMMNAQDNAGVSPTIPVSQPKGKSNTTKLTPTNPVNSNVGKIKRKGIARFQKRMFTPPKAHLDPTKKAK